MSSRILIVYGSRYGHTAKIASYIEERLNAAGSIVTLVNADTLTHAFNIKEFDAVLIGSSVIRGKHRRSVVKFIEKHLGMLNGATCGFFSVSGSAGSTNAVVRGAAQALMEKFLSDLRWNPTLVASFGGAIAYSRYSPLLRWVMKRIARTNGEPTDTTRDYDLTDWARVEAFARLFSELAADPDTLETTAATTSA